MFNNKSKPPLFEQKPCLAYIFNPPKPNVNQQNQASPKLVNHTSSVSSSIEHKLKIFLTTNLQKKNA